MLRKQCKKRVFSFKISNSFAKIRFFQEIEVYLQRFVVIKAIINEVVVFGYTLGL